MKKNKKYIPILVCLILLVWVHPSMVQAQTPSVNDCLENEINCEFQEEGTSENDQSNLEENQSSTQMTGQVSGNMFVNFLKLILALALVLALIYFLLKLVNRKNKLFQRHHTLENMGGISLGPQKSMQIVRIGKQYYVVGVGENVDLLTEITDQQTIEELLAKENSGEFNTADLVNTILGKKNGKEPANKQGKEDFASVFSKELQTLNNGRKKTFAKYLNKGERENE